MKTIISLALVFSLLSTAFGLSDSVFGFQQAFVLRQTTDIEYVLNNEELVYLILYFKRGDEKSQQLAVSLKQVGEKYESLAGFILVDCDNMKDKKDSLCAEPEKLPRLNYALPPKNRLNYEKKEMNKHSVWEYELEKGTSFEALDKLLESKIPFFGIELDNDNMDMHLKYLINQQ